MDIVSIEEFHDDGYSGNVILPLQANCSCVGRYDCPSRIADLVIFGCLELGADGGTR